MATRYSAVPKILMTLMALVFPALTQEYRSLRIAYINTFNNPDQSGNPSVPGAFVVRAAQSGYTHIMVEFYIDGRNPHDIADWSDGRYRPGRNPRYNDGYLYHQLLGFLDTIRTAGLDFIPFIHVPGTGPGPYSVNSWAAALRKSPIAVYNGDPGTANDDLPCISSGVPVPGNPDFHPEFEYAFMDFLEVLRQVCSTRNYSLAYCALGYSECVVNKPPFEPFWGEKGSIDETWMNSFTPKKDVADLVIASVTERLVNMKSIAGSGGFSQTRLILFGDMFSNTFQKAKGRPGISTAALPGRVRERNDAFFSDNVIMMPWWFYSTNEVNIGDFDTKAMLREFTGNNLKTFYMSCIADWDFTSGNENLSVSRSYITQMLKFVETVRSFPESIIGYAAATWNATGYRLGGTDKGWNVLEFLAYANQVARPDPGMVEIPGGGGGRDGSGLPVGALLCSRTEVTQGEYLAITGRFAPSFNAYTADPAYPVENITFCDAVIYCNARSRSDYLQPVYSFTDPEYNGERCVGFGAFSADTSKNGYRLPSPGEWTRLYRAGSVSAFYWGDSLDERYCWSERNSGGTSRRAGGKSPNRWGLFDMAGNVEELTCDYSAIGTRRFAGRKGGDFLGGASRCRASCPVATMALYNYDNTIGFRIVRKAAK